ncbi:MAG: hypothetical protein AB1801_03145 [Chloroflexota bacterium]
MNIPDLDPSTPAENKSTADDAELIEQTTDAESPVVEDSEIPVILSSTSQPKVSRRSRREFLWLAAAFAAGLGSGYVLRGWPWLGPSGPAAAAKTAPKSTDDKAEATTPAIQISLPDEYSLPVAYGDLGPRLLEAGAIDDDQFSQVYEQAGQPLSPEQRAILTAGSAAPVVINRDNAYFLLNFFWAAGLAAQDVSGAEMFEAAKYLNAFWFPQQTYELALAFNQGQGLAFAEVDARELVSANFSSSTGFRAVHQWLADNNLLQQAPGGGNSCGV